MKYPHSPHTKGNKTSGKFARSGTANSLRIIGGQWRGRRISFPAVEGLRPTGDRIRETLFNWLAADIPDARCLDLFAGAGALGFEALSRGAAEVVMIDKHPAVTEQLRAQLLKLDCNRGKVVEADALEWLNNVTKTNNMAFNVIFVDPPFQTQLWQGTMTALENAGLMGVETAVYIETPRDAVLQAPANWRLHREKLAGHVCFRLYYKR